MLRKLIKHELHATSRVIPFLLGFLTVLIVCCTLAARLSESVGYAYGMGILGLGFAILIGTIALILVCCLQGYRYYCSMYSLEGYLTHSLPVSGFRLFMSKTIVTFIWLLLCCVSVFATSSIILSIVTEQSGFDKSELLSIFSSYTNSFWFIVFALDKISPTAFIVFYSIAAIDVFAMSAVINFSITVGCSTRLRCIGAAAPVIALFVILPTYYFSVMSVDIFLPLTMSIDGTVLFSAINLSSQTTFGLGSAVLELAILAFIIPVSSHLISRHTSLR